MSKNWDDELKKIDRQLESISDEAILPTKNVESPVVRAEIKEKHAKTTTLGVVARLLLAVSLGVGMVFWPYSSRCGAGLAAYLGAVSVLIGAGVWTSIWRASIPASSSRRPICKRPSRPTTSWSAWRTTWRCRRSIAPRCSR